MWTNMRATAGHFNFDDFGATAWTWCTFFAKNLFAMSVHVEVVYVVHVVAAVMLLL